MGKVYTLEATLRVKSAKSNSVHRRQPEKRSGFLGAVFVGHLLREDGDTGRESVILTQSEFVGE